MINPNATSFTAEADDDDSEDDSFLTSKKKKVGGMLRGLFKKRRFGESGEPTPLFAGAAANAEPTATESRIPLYGFLMGAEKSSESTEDEEESFAEETKVPYVPLEAENVSSNAETPDESVSAAEQAPETASAEATAYPEEEQPAEPPRPPEPPKPPVPPSGGSSGGFNSIPPPMQPAAEAAPSQPSQTVIEKRGGGIGPLIAFLAANYLSRRRDKKIRRKAEKLNKKIEETKEQASADRQRAGAAEAKSQAEKREQAGKIAALERAVASKNEQEPPEPAPEFKTNPVKVSEVLAASKMNKEQPPKAEQPAPAEKPKEKFRVPPEFLKKPEAEPKPEIQPKPVSEAAFERRHEVKDSSAKVASKVASGLPFITPAASQQKTQSVPAIDNNSQQALDPNIPVLPLKYPDEMYKKSILQGVLVGVAAIMLGVAGWAFGLI